jgi:hypothetical protein
MWEWLGPDRMRPCQVYNEDDALFAVCSMIDGVFVGPFEVVTACWELAVAIRDSLNSKQARQGLPDKKIFWCIVWID